MGFILTAPVHYWTAADQQRKPSKKKHWGIVDFIDGYGRTCQDLAAYIHENSELYGKIKRIYFKYDNLNQIIVFRVRLDIEERVDENGNELIGCYCGSDYDYLKHALLDYINGQISDGWAEDGVMLMSYYDYKILNICVGNASFYEPESIEDCITFEH